MEHVPFQISVLGFFFFLIGMYSGVDLLCHMIVLFFIYQETSILFFMVAAPMYIPTTGYKGSCSPHPRQRLLFVFILMIVILELSG